LPVSIYKRAPLPPGLLFGEGISGELSSMEGYKKKKMHIFSFGVNISTHRD